METSPVIGCPRHEDRNNRDDFADQKRQVRTMGGLSNSIELP